MNAERMLTRATITTSPPGEVSDIRRIQDIADRIGASRTTVTNVEQERPGVSGAAYFRVLWGPSRGFGVARSIR